MIEVAKQLTPKSYLRTRQLAHYSGNTNGTIARLLHLATCAILILLAVAACGCVNTEIRAAQDEMAKGNFAAAHERFLAASHSTRLTAREWRELADGLCTTEVNIGEPQYPLAEQRETCARAAARSGSSSGPMIVRIDSAERLATNDAVDDALRTGDIAGADTAVVEYQSFPGADQDTIAQWSRQIWSTLEKQEGRNKYRGHHLVPAIAAVSHRYPRMRAMNDAAFKHWVMKNTTVASEALVDHIDLREGAIDLRVASASLPNVALNLDRFARINDAMVARCRCEGRTNIAVEGSGLPAYLLRFDPETQQSEVLVMPQPH